MSICSWRSWVTRELENKEWRVSSPGTQGVRSVLLRPHPAPVCTLCFYSRVVPLQLLYFFL